MNASAARPWRAKAETGRAALARWLGSSDVPFVLAAVVYSAIVWWPTRTLPYHWDGASFVIESARDLRASHFWPFVPIHVDFAHPPLFVGALAASWSLFGESRLVSHLFVFPVLPLAMLGTYLLGKRFGGAELGWAAAFVFATTAGVVSEYGQIYVDLPLAAPIAIGLWAWTGNRRALAGACFSLAALIKLPALVVPASLAPLLLLRRETRRDAHAILALALPFGVVGAWLVYHREVVGWLISRPGREHEAPVDLTGFFHVVLVVLRELFVDQLRWLVVAAAALGVLGYAFKKRALPALAPILPLVAVVVGACIFYGFWGEFALRYALFVLPAFFVALLFVARLAPWPRGAFLLTSALVCAAFGTTWHPNVGKTSAYSFRPEQNLAYVDMITIGQQAARWLETKHPDAHVFGAFPEVYQLEEPYQGYVDRPLRFSYCKDFAPEPDVEQLVYVHAYSPGQRVCKRLVDGVSAQAVKRFESNGKWLEIWRVPRMPAPDVAAPPPP